MTSALLADSADLRQIVQGEDFEMLARLPCMPASGTIYAKPE